MGFVNREIQNILNKKITIAGTAVTLAIPGQDSTLLHHIIQFLRRGDILCIDSKVLLRTTKNRKHCPRLI